MYKNKSLLHVNWDSCLYSIGYLTIKSTKVLDYIHNKIIKLINIYALNKYEVRCKLKNGLLYSWDNGRTSTNTFINILFNLLSKIRMLHHTHKSHTHTRAPAHTHYTTLIWLCNLTVVDTLYNTINTGLGSKIDYDDLIVV